MPPGRRPARMIAGAMVTPPRQQAAQPRDSVCRRRLRTMAFLMALTGASASNQCDPLPTVNLPNADCVCTSTNGNVIQECNSTISVFDAVSVTMGLRIELRICHATPRVAIDYLCSSDEVAAATDGISCVTSACPGSTNVCPCTEAGWRPLHELMYGSGDVDIPLPGLSILVPALGSVGVHVHASLAGSPAATTFELAIGGCIGCDTCNADMCLGSYLKM